MTSPNDVLGFDIKSLCFDGPEDRLNQTDISQPAIYTTAAACYRAAVEAGTIDPTEVSAYAVPEPRRVHRACTWPAWFTFEEGLATGRRPRQVHAGGGRRDA